MQNTDMKDKIMALLRKAADSAATVAEAEGAMALAQKLMAKHSLSQDDVTQSAEDAFCYRSINPKQTRAGVMYVDPITMYCGKMVSEFCGCVLWLGEGKTAKWAGVASDIELAMWMLEAFRDQMETDWTIFKRHELGTNRLVVLTDARRSFLHGFTRAIAGRLNDWMYRTPLAGETTGTALVVSKRESALARMRKDGIHLGKARYRGNQGSHSGAAGAGMNAGNSASMGRAMGGGVRMIGGM